jgi:TrmH family RNA methyltransferase
MRISSTSNPRIKEIRALRQRKERAQSGLAFIEGIRIVADALHHPGTVESLVVAPDLLTSSYAQELLRKQQSADVPTLEVSAEVFQSFSLKDGPQGIGAIIYQRWESLNAVRLAQEDFCWVALDAVQDPGNLGTILRTCDAVGCAGVLLLGHCTDPYDPGALRSSMGAVFSQRLVRASYDAFVAWKQQHDYFVVGTSDAAASDYTKSLYRFPAILLMGSERQGLAPALQDTCDLVVSIPMVGQSDSLNLAVATGVMLYELFNRRRKPGI